MERKVITEEMKQALLAPLPDEAISQHPTKTFLSTIKAIYVTERLNDVFGVGAWKIKTDLPLQCWEIDEHCIELMWLKPVSG